MKEYRQLFYTFKEIMQKKTFDKTNYGTAIFINIEIFGLTQDYVLYTLRKEGSSMVLQNGQRIYLEHFTI